MTLHFYLEAALLGALSREFIVVFRVELHRQRVVVAGQRAALARGSGSGQAEHKSKSISSPGLSSEFSGLAMAWLDSPAAGVSKGRACGRSEPRKLRAP